MATVQKHLAVKGFNQSNLSSFVYTEHNKPTRKGSDKKKAKQQEGSQPVTLRVKPALDETKQQQQQQQQQQENTNKNTNDKTHPSGSQLPNKTTTTNGADQNKPQEKPQQFYLQCMTNL